MKYVNLFTNIECLYILYSLAWKVYLNGLFLCVYRVGGYGVAQTGAGMNGAPGGGPGVTDGTGGQQYHQGNALSTAAMVAAATATATATASVVALQENNQFNQVIT